MNNRGSINSGMLEPSDFLKSDFEPSSELAPYQSHIYYGYSLLAIAGADEDVSDLEMGWLIDHQRRLGVPDAALEQYRKFDYRNADLLDLLSRIKVDALNWAVERSLLYHAIKMSKADGEFSKEEREAVMRAARTLNITGDIAQTIVRLVEMEDAVEGMRKAIFNHS